MKSCWGAATKKWDRFSNLLPACQSEKPKVETSLSFRFGTVLMVHCWQIFSDHLESQKFNFVCHSITEDLPDEFCYPCLRCSSVEVKAAGWSGRNHSPRSFCMFTDTNWIGWLITKQGKLLQKSSQHLGFFSEDHELLINTHWDFFFGACQFHPRNGLCL